MKQNHAFRQAVVIGGSMASLLAARALSNHFAQVTVLERDRSTTGRSRPKDSRQRVMRTLCSPRGCKSSTTIFPN